MLWGVENEVIERFKAAGVGSEAITFSRDTYTFNFNGTPAQFVDVFKTYYGPTMNAFEAADRLGRSSDLRRELETLFAKENISATPDRTTIPARYLKVSVFV
jgi:hypothetical protein